jgi:hypothetical protein
VLESWLELRPEGVWLLQGRAVPTRQGTTLGLVRDVLTQRFAVLDRDAPTEVATKLRAGLASALTHSEADLVGRDEFDHALGHFRAGLEGAQGHGDLAAEAGAHGNLGVTLHLQGDATGNPAWHREAIVHYELEHSG